MALNICAEGYTSSKIVLLHLGLTDKVAIWELKQRYETWAAALPVPAQTLLNPLCARLHLKPWTLCPHESMVLFTLSHLGEGTVKTGTLSPRDSTSCNSQVPCY